MTKTCRKCGDPKDREEFPFKNKAKGIRHNTCKACQKGYNEKYYEANKGELAEKAKLRARAKKDA